MDAFVTKISNFLSVVILANWNLTIKPSESAVFSRYFTRLAFQPYGFPLVFALTIQNKGNHLLEVPNCFIDR